MRDGCGEYCIGQRKGYELKEGFKGGRTGAVDARLLWRTSTRVEVKEEYP